MMAMREEFVTGLLGVAMAYAAAITVYVIAHPPKAVVTHTEVPSFVVSAGEIRLCTEVCQYRMKAALSEIYRGPKMELDCICADGQTLEIAARDLGRGR